MPPLPTVPPDVSRWIERQDPAERAALARAWQVAGLAADAAPPDATDQAWARLGLALDTPEADRPARRALDRAPAARSRVLRWASAGALLAAVAVAAAVWWPRGTTLTADGRVLVAVLPDGSEVTLAPGSRLRFARGLAGDERRVTLEGQGYFDVATAGRPFVVETFNASVEVLGTEFDVQAWARASETAVALVEGSVRFRSHEAAVTLDPGQVSRVVGRGAPTPPVPADVSAVASWRSGGFAVVNAPLASVAAAVQARFGRAVSIGPGVDGARRLTLFLPTADTADAVLRDVTAYLDLRLQSGPDGFTVLSR